MFLFQIFTDEESIDNTLSSWNAISLIGNPNKWSLTLNGLLERRSYKSIWPVAVPTPNVNAFSNSNAVTEGNPSELRLKSKQL